MISNSRVPSFGMSSDGGEERGARYSRAGVRVEAHAERHSHRTVLTETHVA